MTDEELDALVDRMCNITGYKYASRDQCLLNCSLGTIELGDISDLCAAITTLRAQLAEARANERQWIEKMVDADTRAALAEIKGESRE